MTTFIIILTALLFSFAFLSIIWTGGLRNNLFHFFIIFIQFFYFFNSPVHYYNTGHWLAFNTDVRDYFTTGFIQIFLHLLFYLVGYSVLSRKTNEGYPEQLAVVIPFYKKSIIKKIISIFLILFIVIFLNTLFSGINFVDIILGKFEGGTLGLRGGTYYLQNFADSLITLLIAAFYFKAPKKFLLLMIFFAFILFIILGFRYRILLTLFGFCLVHVLKNKIRWLAFVKYAVVAFTAFYFLMFITQNRFALYTQRYSTIEYDPMEFDYEGIYNETFGSMVDFSLYKAYDEKIFENDHGLTMFGIIFVKMVPASFFPGGKKPYPPPQLLAIDKSLNVTREYGQASTAIGGLFFAFNYPGIYLGGFALGLLIGGMQRRINGSNVFRPLLGLVVTLTMFQWLTRGYFPQEVDHFAYLSFPIFVLAWWMKRDQSFHPPATIKLQD